MTTSFPLDIEKKLQKVVADIDVMIDDAKTMLEIRRSSTKDSTSPWIEGAAMRLNAWEGAKRYLLREFPMLYDDKAK